MKGTAEWHSLYQRYLCHYTAASREGRLVLCGRGDGASGSLYAQLITDNLGKRKREDKADLITLMIKGFAILELICVNLFLYPWRKEIRTLKKFTGNYVYFVEPVIPEKIVNQILQRVGYSIVRETEYIIGETINVEEAKHSAFELYLARCHCEELMCLIHDNKTECGNVLFNEPNLQVKNEPENGEKCAKMGYQTGDVNSLASKITQDATSRDAEKPSASWPGLAAAQNLIHDSATDSSYCFSRHLDSEEFLNKYSDLNLAQQPILPLQNRPISSNPQELREDRLQGATEPKLVKLNVPESELDLYEAGETECDAETSENTQMKMFSTDLTKSGAKKRPGLDEYLAELNLPNRPGQMERLVIKLKMGKTDHESLAYPVEETSPPDPKVFPNTGVLCHRDPKWTYPRNKEIVESPCSASFSSTFSMLNEIPSKGKEQCGGIENQHRVREPPNSTYIPPGGAERQCLRITDTQAEEPHCKAVSPPADMVVVQETMFKVNEDTNEDFVLITKNQQP
ncbi:uncharacterized protein [Hyperolius riggenbachi]|uniref:uncharacterized protein n=1 Tax=Hyperolius riggenbachi TaxID=752182 RepID=UPI0035A37A04